MNKLRSLVAGAFLASCGGVQNQPKEPYYVKKIPSAAEIGPLLDKVKKGCHTAIEAAKGQHILKTKKVRHLRQAPYRAKETKESIGPESGDKCFLVETQIPKPFGGEENVTAVINSEQGLIFDGPQIVSMRTNADAPTYRICDMVNGYGTFCQEVTTDQEPQVQEAFELLKTEIRYLPLATKDPTPHQWKYEDLVYPSLEATSQAMYHSTVNMCTGILKDHLEGSNEEMSGPTQTITSTDDGIRHDVLRVASGIDTCQFDYDMHDSDEVKFGDKLVVSIQTLSTSSDPNEPPERRISLIARRDPTHYFIDAEACMDDVNLGSMCLPISEGEGEAWALYQGVAGLFIQHQMEKQKRERRHHVDDQQCSAY